MFPRFVGGAGPGAWAVVFAFVLAFSLAGFFGPSVKFGILVLGIAAVGFSVSFAGRPVLTGRFKTPLYVLNWLFFVGAAFAAFYILPRLETMDIPIGTSPFGAPPATSWSPLVIVFMTLLPLANAPLDWLSLGLTRGLLRYGLARGGTWRIAAVSLVDIVFAATLIFPLAAITTAAVCLANWFAVSGGGEAVLPIVSMLESMRNAPGDPRYYWIYLMLLSTLVPSFVHILGGLLGLMLVFVQRVFESALLAEEFVSAENDEHATKDTKLLYWYPTLAAFGATGAFAIILLLVVVVPYVGGLAIYFADYLLATAKWTARFFPA